MEECKVPADETELIARACRGDAAALGELYTRYSDRVYRYLYYRTSDRALAEDLTAEVFLRMVEGIGSYDQREIPFAAWLYRIARARLVDHWRDAGQREIVLLEDEADSETLGEERDDLEQVASAEQFSQLLQTLTSDQQEVLILRFVEGLTHAEIGRILGKSEGAVKALQRRALHRLAGEVKAT